MVETKSDSGYVDDWQRDKSLIECNLHMLDTREASDVSFRVGDLKEEVSAHKYMLISRSCVFHAMFCGPLAEKGKVTIPDIEPDIFREFLKYLYSDIADVKPDNVIGLLYTSRKYAIDTLYMKCITFLENTLSQDNVCDILEQCQGYGEKDLEEKALGILIKAGKNVVQSPGFLNLSPHFFKKFIQSEDLKVKEKEVFTSSLKWAKEQCRMRNIEPSSESLRDMLGEHIYDIRFAAMSLEYIVKVVGATGIITREERVAIIDKIVDPAVELKLFKLRRKPSDQASVMNITQRFPCESLTWPYKWASQVNAIMFSASDDIELVGCQLYGPIRNDSTYTVTIEVLDEEQIIATPISGARITLEYNQHINDVMFPSPVETRRNKMYTLSMGMLDGEVTFYGENGKESVVTKGVTFTFKDSPLCTAPTNTRQGQIPGLIWM